MKSNWQYNRPDIGLNITEIYLIKFIHMYLKVRTKHVNNKHVLLSCLSLAGKSEKAADLKFDI